MRHSTCEYYNADLCMLHEHTFPNNYRLPFFTEDFAHLGYIFTNCRTWDITLPPSAYGHPAAFFASTLLATHFHFTMPFRDARVSCILYGFLQDFMPGLTTMQQHHRYITTHWYGDASRRLFMICGHQLLPFHEPWTRCLFGWAGIYDESCRCPNTAIFCDKRRSCRRLSC
jgi:hypothetical protein